MSSPDVLDEIERAVRDAYAKGRRDAVVGLKIAAELNGSLPSVLSAVVDPSREERINKAYIESQHPRDRTGRWIDKADIDRLAHSPEGVQHLLAITRPSDRMAMVRAIQGAQQSKQHGMPNVAQPRSPESEHVDEQGAPGERGSPQLAKTIETVAQAQKLIANVKEGAMPGDPARLERMLSKFFEGLPPKVVDEFRRHAGTHGGHTPASLAKWVAGGGDVAGPPKPAALPKKQKEDPFGMKPVAERDKPSGKPGDMRPNEALDDFFSRPAEAAKPKDQPLRHSPDLDAAMGMGSSPAATGKPSSEAEQIKERAAAWRKKQAEEEAAKTPAGAEKPAPEPPAEEDKPKPTRKPVEFGPWSPDDLLEAAKPLRKEMEDTAHDPESFVRAAHEYGTWLKQFSPDELDGLAKTLGVDGAKGPLAVLSSRLAVKALGREHPGEGHTGLVRTADGAETKYQDGAVVTHTPAGEEKPAPTPEQAPADKTAALDKVVPAEPPRGDEGSPVGEISKHLLNPNSAMRDQAAVRQRLATRLSDPEHLAAVAKKVLGRNVAEHLPVTEQRDVLLDKLARFASAKAEGIHGKVAKPAPTPREVAERLKEGHERQSRWLRESQEGKGPFAGSNFSQNALAQKNNRESRAWFGKQMKEHLKKNPELAADYGKYAGAEDANPPAAKETVEPTAKRPVPGHNVTQTHIDAWKKQMLDFNYSPAEVDEAERMAKKRGIDPTRSDDLESLDAYMTSIENSAKEDHGMTDAEIEAHPQLETHVKQKDEEARQREKAAESNPAPTPPAREPGDETPESLVGQPDEPKPSGGVTLGKGEPGGKRIDGRQLTKHVIYGPDGKEGGHVNVHQSGGTLHVDWGGLKGAGATDKEAKGAAGAKNVIGAITALAKEYPDAVAATWTPAEGRLNAGEAKWMDLEKVRQRAARGQEPPVPSEVSPTAATEEHAPGGEAPGVTDTGTLKPRRGEGALTARRQGKKFAVQWETPEGELRHSLHTSEEDAKLQHEIMSRDKDVAPGTAKIIKPGELKTPQKKREYLSKNPKIRAGTLADAVRRYGGLDPDAYERTFGSVKEAIENGVPASVFKNKQGSKGNQHLDTLAKELKETGDLSQHGDDVHEHYHLMDELTAGKLTPEGAARHHEQLLRDFEREQQAAHVEEQRRKDEGLDVHSPAEIGEAASGGEAAEGVRGEVGGAPEGEGGKQVESDTSGGQKNLLVETLPKTFTANRGTQLSLDDAHRERDRTGEPQPEMGTAADMGAEDKGTLFAPENAAPTPALEPWQQTKEEYAKTSGKRLPETFSHFPEHRESIADALKAGKPVPTEVRTQYLKELAQEGANVHGGTRGKPLMSGSELPSASGPGPSPGPYNLNPRPLSPHLLMGEDTRTALRGLVDPHEVSGNLFPYKQELRDLGGRYDRKRRVWYIPGESVPKLTGKVAVRPVYGKPDVAKSFAAGYADQVEALTV
jgi:hypothetical protein